MFLTGPVDDPNTASDDDESETTSERAHGITTPPNDDLDIDALIGKIINDVDIRR